MKCDRYYGTDQEIVNDGRRAGLNYLVYRFREHSMTGEQYRRRDRISGWLTAFLSACLSPVSVSRVPRLDALFMKRDHPFVSLDGAGYGMVRGNSMRKCFGRDHLLCFI